MCPFLIESAGPACFLTVRERLVQSTFSYVLVTLLSCKMSCARVLLINEILSNREVLILLSNSSFVCLYSHFQLSL